MTKYKEGDEVRVLNQGTSCFRPGHVGKITEVENNSMSQPYNLDHREGGWVYEEDIELVKKPVAKKKKIKYPVGSTVTLNKETIEADKLSQGVWYKGPLEVVGYTKGADRPYQVKYLKGMLAGHVVGKKLNVRHLLPYEKPVDNEPSKEPTRREIGEARVKKAEKTFEQEMSNYLKQMEVDAARLRMTAPTIIIKPIKKEKKNIMTTIRQKIAYAALSGDEKVLRENDILDNTGALTDVGRRVVLDILFQDKDLRSTVVEAVKTTLPKEK